MNRIVFAFTFLLLNSAFIPAFGHNNLVDSLKKEIELTKEDSSKAKIYNDIAWEYIFRNPDTSLIISRQALFFSKKAKSEKFIITSLNNIATAFAIQGNYDSSLFYFQEAKTIALKRNEPKELTMIHNNIGLVFWNQGKLDSAIVEYNLALDAFRRKKDTSGGMANTYNNLGLIYSDKGMYPEAVESYQNALDIFNKKEIKDRGVANVYNNLGNIYKARGDFSNALDKYLNAIRLLEEINDRSDGYANTLSNIGIIYDKQGDFEKALNYFNKSIEAHKSISKKSNGLSNVLNNVGNIYSSRKKYDEALAYFEEVIEIQLSIGGQSTILSETYQNIGGLMEAKNELKQAEYYYSKANEIQVNNSDQRGIANSLIAWGTLKLSNNDISSGIEKCGQGLDIADKLALLELQMKACNCLYRGFEKKNEIKKALNYFKLYVNHKDSLNNQEKTKAITQKSMQYEFDKIQYQDSLQRAADQRKKELIQQEKDLKKEAEIQQQKIYTIAGGIGFILMLGLAFVLYRGYKSKQKANEVITAKKEEVEQQKEIIEEKNKEILDSINYAKRIQTSILPSREYVAKILPESFVLFQPKDIVSGDFYWIEKKGEYIYFAAVDCTGHGVPGALVSVVGHNCLNRVLNEEKIIEPSKMLDKLNELVEQTFSKKTDSVKDGMDMALCRFHPKTKELVYAGANNSLYLVRNESQANLPISEFAEISHTNKKGQNLYEIKPDKQPIGKFEYRKEFTEHTIQLVENDMIYIFSDGYADQFGGEKGKKFMYKPFKRLLTDLSTLKVKTQEKKLFYHFDEWKGELEQIDDVCIIGVRI